MKRAAIFTLCLIFASSSFIHAEDAEQAPTERTTHQKAFLNLPEENRVKFVDIINEAMRLFKQKRIFETLEKIHEAKHIFDGSPEVMNLEASCYVELRNFERALEIYLKGEELAPENSSIKFNIAEVYFVTNQWQKSHDRFSELMTKIPPENIAMTRLIEFKLLLNKLRLDKADEAYILASKYDFRDDSPFYYYAQAALEFEAGNAVKAQEWLGICSRVFRNPEVIAPWQDTLVEFGHIKGFYGENDAKAE